MIKPKTFVSSVILTMVALISQHADGQVLFGSTNDGSGSGTHSAGHLTGHIIYVSEEAILTHIGIIFDQPGGTCRAGIYADSEDQPGKLLGEIPALRIRDRGATELPIAEPLVLSPGNYWVMIACNRDTKISKSQSASTKVCYRPFVFDETMPDPIGITTNYMTTSTEDVYLKCNYIKEDVCPFSSAPAGEIYFPTIKGKVYQVQFTEDIESPNWQPFAPPFTATGANTNIFFSTRNTPKRRYRVIVK